MKKIASVLMAVVIASVMAFGLFGCAKTPDYVGKYDLSSIEAKGITVDGDLLKQVLPSMGGAEGNYLEIKDGKNLTVAFGGSSFSMKYTANGNTLTVKDASGSADFVVSGDTVTVKFTEELVGPGNACTAIFKKR